MKVFILVALLAVSISARYLNQGDTLDLNKYSGKWFEIARKNTYYTESCTCSKSEFEVATREPTFLEPERLYYLIYAS